MQDFLRCGRYRLAVGPDARPLVMGVLNVTPDSFSDGGQFVSLDVALSRAEQMIADEVDIIDIGGESSRPGAEPLPIEEELRRVMPVLYALRDCGKPLSVDTYKPEVMRHVLAAGADLINDINGFRAPGALNAINAGDCGLCIMHMQNDPLTMQRNPHYEQSVVDEVTQFLQYRVADLQQSGIERERICIDPGFGFGKTLAHNLELLKNLNQIQKRLDLPLMAGLSRKSTIGALTGRGIDERLAGSIAAAVVAASHGARIIRVHDVAQTVDAMKIWHAAKIE